MHDRRPVEKTLKHAGKTFCLARLKHKWRKFWSWNPAIKNALFKFLRKADSCIHGLRYVVEIKCPLIQRVFWLIALINGFGFSLHLIKSGVLMPLLASPVIISFEGQDTAISDIPFPAVTICNTNMIRSGPYRRLMSKVRKDAELYHVNYQELLNNKTYQDLFMIRAKALAQLHNFCRSTTSFGEQFFPSQFHKNDLPPLMFEGNNDYTSDIFQSIEEVTSRPYHRCSDMLLRCMWNGEIIDCLSIFYIVSTEYGNCCVFNMMPPFVLRTISNRQEYRFRTMNRSIIEAWENWDIDDDLIYIEKEKSRKRKRKKVPRRQNEAGSRSGLKVLLNLENSQNFDKCRTQDSTGFRVQVHSPIDNPHVSELAKTVSAGTETFMAVNAEITTPERGLENLPIRERRCYFLDEFHLEAFKFYTQNNCFDECIMKKTFNICECIQFNMPRLQNATICHSQKHLGCLRDMQKNYTKTGIRRLCAMCLPSCTQIDYFAEATELPLRDDIDLWESSNFADSLWKNESLTILHVYFANDVVESRVRKRLYGFEDIVGDCGGFLGLTLGFCMQSFIELVFLLVSKCFRKCKSIWNEKRKAKPFSPTKVLVNPSDFMKWSDVYLNEKFRQRRLMLHKDFIDNS